MDNQVIRFDGVCKTYYKSRYRYSSITDTIKHLFIHKGEEVPEVKIKVLDSISFSVYKGEVVGLIGPNGAGKSTILKLISRVTYPDSGKITINGNVGALIEVGAGFHPELSGRENIFVNGVLLGLTRKQIRKKFDEIVEFAELKDYIDMPVKRYSSGMFIRLGFSIIVCINPDILLVDEAFAVGDAEFQKKSLLKIQSFKEDGKPMILVSHNVYAIESLCTRCIWIEKGKIKGDGPAKDVLEAYLNFHNIKRKEDIFNLDIKDDY